MIELLWPAFLVSVVLLGIHAWFGLAIIRRNIIFTDLAIGQMAALGTAIALWAFDGQWRYPLSLGCALLGGLWIGLVSRQEKDSEPLIGLLYALGVAGVSLLLSRSPHGMEAFQNLIAYDILYTSLTDIGKTALLYAVLAVLLWFIRHWQGLAYDLAFFTIFAVTVTSSVQLGGVLVVFALLIGPALMALQIRKGSPLAWAWGLGTGFNLLALLLSYKLDLPTGYTVVFVQALAALLFVSAAMIWRSRKVSPHQVLP